MTVVESLTEQLRGWRRYLHQNPELSFAEFETADYIESELKAMGLAPVRLAKTGVYVDIEGLPGPHAVAIRADIDALPVEEETGLAFASARKGVMHACGHDGHAAIALGVAKRLLGAREEFAGRMRVFFQPAEELPPGGAREMIADGVLDGIDAVIGLHLWSFLPVGVAGLAIGPLTANSDFFDVEIQGRGGHGAVPQTAVDAVIVGSAIVQRLQAIVSRQVDPLEPIVITVGSFHAGSKHNIIADKAVLQGTVRTASEAVREFVEAEMIRVCRGVADSYGATAKFRYTRGYPAVVNHSHAVKIFEDVCRRRLGEAGVSWVRPTMVGEDFAYYLRERPGAFLLLGAGSQEANSEFPHHHPRFTVDESALEQGVDILTDTALALIRDPVGT